MRYFDLAAPHHHEDEERHVLPRLRECGHAALAERVLREHAVMAVAWADVRGVLQGIELGRRPVDAAAVARHWLAFAALYREHIELEERDVFPLAREHTGADGLRAMADEMARRRGAR
jgi:hemerythrin-like domain-containing protein